jgi:hypothetical protein
VRGAGLARKRAVLYIAMLSTLLAGCSEGLAFAYVAQGVFLMPGHESDTSDTSDREPSTDEMETKIRYRHAITPCTKGDASACLVVALYLDGHDMNPRGAIAAYEYACANNNAFACERAAVLRAN